MYRTYKYKREKREVTLAKVVLFAVLLFVIALPFTGCAKSPTTGVSDVKVEGTEGDEPKVTIPKDLDAEDETFQQLRAGTGQKLTTGDEVRFKVQKVGLHDTSKVYSSWQDKDAPEMTVDLSDAYKEQVPADLRALLLKANVGAVIAYVTTGSLSDLTNGEVTDDKKVKQVWIITITGRDDVVAPYADPYEKK